MLFQCIAGTAFINICNKRVGTIAWDADTELAFFNLSPLKMPVTGATKRVFSFPELRDTTTFKGLPGLKAGTSSAVFDKPLYEIF